MTKTFWILSTVLVVSAMSVVIVLNLGPKNVPVIKPSHLENPQQLGTAISNRMRDQMHKDSVVWLGVMSENPLHYAIWESFLKTSEEQGFKFDYIVAAQELNNIPQGMVSEKVDLRGNLDGFADGIKSLTQQGKRVAVLVPSEYATRTVVSGIGHVYAQKFQDKPLALAIFTYPRDLEESRAMPIPCVTVNDNTGNGELGCELQLKGKILAKKQKQKDKYFAAMDLVGEKDYHIYFSAPKQ